ncbi:hypothetical protein XENTR_v10003752 [Xenopus tropicalis]|nr:hypothetical protein XENTR_v10003752 [Xenopus tropicalis]
MAAAKSQDQWSQEDVLTLLQAMKAIIPSPDISEFKATEYHLDWNNLAFKNYSGSMCRQKWMDLTAKQQVRKHRTLEELVLDAEKHVQNLSKSPKNYVEPLRNPLKKPLTPYIRFFLAKRPKYVTQYPNLSTVDLTKVLSKEFRELPAEHKVGQEQNLESD